MFQMMQMMQQAMCRNGQSDIPIKFMGGLNAMTDGHGAFGSRPMIMAGSGVVRGGGQQGHVHPGISMASADQFGGDMY